MSGVDTPDTGISDRNLDGRSGNLLPGLAVPSEDCTFRLGVHSPNMVLLTDVQIGELSLDVLPPVLAQILEDIHVGVHSPHRFTDGNVAEGSLDGDPLSSLPLVNGLLLGDSPDTGMTNGNTVELSRELLPSSQNGQLGRLGSLSGRSLALDPGSLSTGRLLGYLTLPQCELVALSRFLGHTTAI